MNWQAKHVPQPAAQKQVFVITLKKGDTAWMPGTTKHVFYGPAVLTYTVWPDGGVDCHKS